MERYTVEILRICNKYLELVSSNNDTSDIKCITPITIIQGIQLFAMKNRYKLKVSRKNLIIRIDRQKIIIRWYYTKRRIAEIYLNAMLIMAYSMYIDLLEKGK
jgi:hypothetical protein